MRNTEELVRSEKCNSAAAHRTTDLRVVRILIVDDDPQSRGLLVEFAQRRGYTALTASSGPEAIRAVKEERPHIVLLDHLMPQMSGLDTLAAIRAIDAEAAIVMVTGLGQEELGQWALGMGACEFVTKPVDLRHLDRVVTHCVAAMLF